MLGPLFDVQMSFRVAGARDCAPCQKWAKREGSVATRSTRDMFSRDVRRSGRWFPENGCILEHQIFSFGKVILRDKRSTSYDLPASLPHFCWKWCRLSLSSSDVFITSNLALLCCLIRVVGSKYSYTSIGCFLHPFSASSVATKRGKMGKLNAKWSPALIANIFTIPVAAISCVWPSSSKHFLNPPTVWGLRWCNF